MMNFRKVVLKMSKDGKEKEEIESFANREGFELNVIFSQVKINEQKGLNL